MQIIWRNYGCSCVRQGKVVSRFVDWTCERFIDPMVENMKFLEEFGWTIKWKTRRRFQHRMVCHMSGHPLPNHDFANTVPNILWCDIRPIRPHHCKWQKQVGACKRWNMPSNGRKQHKIQTTDSSHENLICNSCNEEPLGSQNYLRCCHKQSKQRIWTQSPTSALCVWCLGQEHVQERWEQCQPQKWPWFIKRDDRQKIVSKG